MKKNNWLGMAVILSALLLLAFSGAGEEKTQKGCGLGSFDISFNLTNDTRVDVLKPEYVRLNGFVFEQRMAGLGNPFDGIAVYETNSTAYDSSRDFDADRSARQALGILKVANESLTVWHDIVDGRVASIGAGWSPVFGSRVYICYFAIDKKTFGVFSTQEDYKKFTDIAKSLRTKRTIPWTDRELIHL